MAGGGQGHPIHGPRGLPYQCHPPKKEKRAPSTAARGQSSTSCNDRAKGNPLHPPGNGSGPGPGWEEGGGATSRPQQGRGQGEGAGAAPGIPSRAPEGRGRPPHPLPRASGPQRAMPTAPPCTVGGWGVLPRNDCTCKWVMQAPLRWLPHTWWGWRMAAGACLCIWSREGARHTKLVQQNRGPLWPTTSLSTVNGPPSAGQPQTHPPNTLPPTRGTAHLSRRGRGCTGHIGSQGGGGSVRLSGGLGARHGGSGCARHGGSGCASEAIAGGWCGCGG